MKIEAKRIGNSTGFVIPREVVVRLGIEQGKSFFLTETADGGFRIAPYDPDFERAMTAVDELMDEYRDTLRALAK
ncbi:MAG: AbrB family transcriptional regulator [Methylobacteriaceae bacterium]|nr:AbrB family transcriptional regulator [Methylobacteriaceae bacterium]